MNNLINTFTLVGLLITTIAFGQLDQQNTINYQGVARDASDEILSNEAIDIRISLRFGAPNATIQYVENHLVTTNASGVFSLQIGSGTPASGAFNTLVWGNLAPFATVMINGSTAGTVQIHSVPFANASGRATQMVLNDLLNVEGAPTIGQVLKFNGSNWAPGVDQSGGGGEVYTAGDGIAISATNEISAVLGTSIESSEIENSAVTTNKIADNSVTGAKIAPMAAANGQVLKYDGTDWTPANDDGQVYNAGDGIAINGSTIEATLGTSIETSEIENNSVTGAKIAPMAAANGQVLKYDGTDWTPANDDGQVYNAGDGIAINGSTIEATLGTSIETSEIENNSVTGAKIAPMAAANGQVLKYNGTDWTPANDNTGGGGTVYTAGDGIAISATDEISADLGTDIETSEIQNNAITAPKIANNAIITSKIQDEAVTGDKIATMAATNGQVLKYDGATWAPANDNTGGGGGPIYTAGVGISISGADVISADLGIDIETSEIQDNAVTGAKIAPMAAAIGQVLKYDGTDWTPADDNAGSPVWETDGTLAYYENGNVAVGTSTPNPLSKFQITESIISFDQSNLELEGINVNRAQLKFSCNFINSSWRQLASYGNIPAYNSMRFLNDTEGYSTVTPLTLRGDGHVGIGNSSPGHDLVIGTNTETTWTIPAATIFGMNGGAIEVGSSSSKLSMHTFLSESTINCSNSNGSGQGITRFRTRQLNIGRDIGSNTSRTYPVRIKQNINGEGGNYGLNIINGVDSDQNWEIYAGTNGNLRLLQDNDFRGIFDGVSGNYSPTSDKRLKTNITTMPSVSEKLLQLQPKKYNYKSNLGKKYNGFLAQDIQELFPEVVSTSEIRNPGETSVLMVDYAQLTVLAIKAIQEQQAEIDILKEDKKEIDGLKARLSVLEAKLFD